MIGETLYTYDSNRRNYLNDDGTRRQSPNPASYWRAHTVTSETRTSWILDDGAYKVDKKTLELRGIRNFYGLTSRVYTPEQKADREWREVHLQDILSRVQSATGATLRQIAALFDKD